MDNPELALAVLWTFTARGGFALWIFLAVFLVADYRRERRTERELKNANR